MSTRQARAVLLILVLILLIGVGYSIYQQRSQISYQVIAYSQFIKDVKANTITDVVIASDEIHGHYQQGKAFKTYKPGNLPHPQLYELLRQHNVNITINKP